AATSTCGSAVVLLVEAIAVLAAIVMARPEDAATIMPRRAAGPVTACPKALRGVRGRRAARWRAPVVVTVTCVCLSCRLRGELSGAGWRFTRLVPLHADRALPLGAGRSRLPILVPPSLPTVSFWTSGGGRVRRPSGGSPIWRVREAFATLQPPPAYVTVRSRSCGDVCRTSHAACALRRRRRGGARRRRAGRGRGATPENAPRPRRRHAGRGRRRRAAGPPP